VNGPIVGLELVDAGAVTVVVAVLGVAAGVGIVVVGVGTMVTVVELTWELWFERIPPAVPPATAARRIKMRRVRISQKVREYKPQIVCLCVGSEELSL
jgi:hypothetical protein